MIVEHWYDLTRAVDKAVPCYTPVQRPPCGHEDRCGDCDGCRDRDKVADALMAVERDIEAILEESETWQERAETARLRAETARLRLVEIMEEHFPAQPLGRNG